MESAGDNRIHFINSLSMLVEQLLRLGSSVVVGIYIARSIGVEQFGVLSLALAFSLLLTSISRMGMDSVLVREILVKPQQSGSLLGSAWGLMLGTSLAAFLVMSVALFFFEGDAETLQVMLAICGGSLFTAFLSIDYFYQASSRALVSSACKSIALIGGSVVKVYIVHEGLGLRWLGFSYLLDGAVLALLLCVALGREGLSSLVFGFRFRIAAELVRCAWPMAVNALAMVVLMRIDQIMLGYYLGPRSVGVYSAALKIYEAWATIPYVITVSLLPMMARMKEEGGEVYYRGLVRIFRMFIWLSLLAVILVSLMGDVLIALTFGAHYRDSASIVGLLMWTGLFAAVGSVSARYFNLERMEKKVLKRTVLGALVNVAANMVLIPSYGIRGAAWATLLTAAYIFYVADWFDDDLVSLLSMKHRALVPWR